MIAVVLIHLDRSEQGAKPANGELRPHPRNVANKKYQEDREAFLAK
jgi:hypothetical protein